MPIEMPKGLPFSVDTWTPSSRIKRYHFLTHAHKDHAPQIPQHASYPIYATPITKTLLLQQFPHQLQESVFVDIEVGQTVAIDDPNDPFSVTAFDANHCPGAVMFLFEGDFGNILHTGDCRLTHDCLQNLPLKYLSDEGKEPKSCLDYLFLDCTFSRDLIEIPSKHEAIQQVLNCIWNHPNAPVVYLACDLLGQEKILEAVFKTFGSKIYVDKARCAEYFQTLTLIVPHILSEDPSSRFQVFEGFPRLYERADKILTVARADLQHEPLFIRPSAQWYACEKRAENKNRKLRFDEAERDQFGVWHVCYSIHSSKGELEWALELLRPKRVISTTPPCLALDLNYVRKHLSTPISDDDSIWQLLKIGAKEFCTSQKSIIPKFMSDGAATSHVAPAKVAPGGSHAGKFGCHLDLSPRSTKPVTLFGRSRLGPQVSDLTQEKATIKTMSTNGDVHEISISMIVKQEEKVRVERSEKLLHPEKERNEEKETVSVGSDDVLMQKSNDMEEVLAEKAKNDAESGVEHRYNTSLRKMYRSMNVAVPRPLPSLVELMGVGKRAKLGSVLEGISS